MDVPAMTGLVENSVLLTCYVFSYAVFVSSRSKLVVTFSKSVQAIELCTTALQRHLPNGCKQAKSRQGFKQPQDLTLVRNL